MFREMRRFKQQLTDEACREVLAAAPRGVLAVTGDDGYPYCFFMNYVYDPSAGKLYFHCAREGYKLDCLRRSAKVCFTVRDEGFRQPDDWALTIRSVIVFGTVRLVEDEAEALPLVRMLGQKYYPDFDDVEAELVKSGHRVMALELTPDHMTGKTVHEK